MRSITLIGPRGLRLFTWVPQTHRERRRGLLGRRELRADEAMLVERARTVHTFGMRFEIMAALLDPDLQVLRLVRLPPHRLLRPRRRVRHVLECGAELDLRIGDRLAEGSVAILPAATPGGAEAPIV